MVNVNKLKAKMVESGIKGEELASAIGIDISTFYRKIKNDGESFSIREANKIVEVLGLTKDEAIAIFFAKIVA